MLSRITQFPVRGLNREESEPVSLGHFNQRHAKAPPQSKLRRCFLYPNIKSNALESEYRVKGVVVTVRNPIHLCRRQKGFEILERVADENTLFGRIL